MTARSGPPVRSLPADAVEFAVPHAAEEGMPLIRRERQDGPSGVSAVANADLATGQARHLDAVAAGITQGALGPVRTRTRLFTAAAERSPSHGTPSLDGVLSYTCNQPSWNASAKYMALPVKVKNEPHSADREATSASPGRGCLTACSSTAIGKGSDVS